MSAELKIDFTISENIDEPTQRAQPQSPAPQPSRPEPKPAQPASQPSAPAEPRRSVFNKPKPPEQVAQTPQQPKRAEQVVTQSKPDAAQEAQVVQPTGRFTLEQWEQLGADAEAVAKQYRMLPPLEVEQRVAQPRQQETPPDEPEQPKQAAPAQSSGPQQSVSQPPAQSSPANRQIQREAKYRLEQRQKRQDIEQEMRRQSDKYRTEQEAKENRKIASPTVEEEAAKRLQREEREKAVDQSMREQSPKHREEAEIEDRYRENAKAIREMTEAAREEKIALAQMTEEQRIAYKVDKEVNRQRETEVVKQRAKEIRQAEKGPEAEEQKPRFDPYAEAQKQREREVRKEQIKAAQEELYGAEKKPQKSTTDQVLDVAQSMRGTIGGMLGPIPGAVLDVVTQVRKAQASQQAPEKSSARQEAERRNREAAQQMPVATRAEDMPVAEAAPPQTEEERQQQPGQSAGQTVQRAAQQAQRAARSAQNQGAQQSATRPPQQPQAQQAVAQPQGAGAAAEGEAAVATEGAAAAGALGELAAVAGPAGAVAVAIVVAAQKLREGSEAVIRGTANTVASFATLKDGATRLDEFGHAASGAADKLTYLNPAASIVVGSMGEVSKGLSQMDRAVKGTADRLAQYDAGLSAQKSQQETVELMREINRAQRYGPNVQAANASRFAADQAMQNITDKFIPLSMKFSEKSFQVLTGILTIIEKMADPILSAADNSAVQTAALSALTLSVPQLMIPLDILVAIGKRAENNANANTSELLWQQFIEAGTNFGNVAGAGPNAATPAPGGVVGPNPGLPGGEVVGGDW